MPILYSVGAVISVALFVYLLFAMVRPEKFE
jgi:K+-transporting ATPase KdpF subunit